MELNNTIISVVIVLLLSISLIVMLLLFYILKLNRRYEDAYTQQFTLQETVNSIHQSLKAYHQDSIDKQYNLLTHTKTHHELQYAQLNQMLQALQHTQDSLRNDIIQQAKTGREDTALQFSHFNTSLQQPLEAQTLRVQTLSDANERRLLDIRNVLEQRLQALQQDNAARLETMRATVDERLQTTLESRLGESFKLVTGHLTDVQKGLGEMRDLAKGVGDLKKVLSNIKTRGCWGETQLAALLEQILTHEQYAMNVETIPNTGLRVEFAVKLPGKHKDQPCWLPIDAKFPKEQYERLLEASDKGDVEGIKTAHKEIETVLIHEAKTISKKYISPPYTTDFAILFLPTEGLYAEVVKRPGLTDKLQREYRIMVAGPTTVMALLSSLQMGFKTLAIEQRASEVWGVLSEVKSEFLKFGDSFKAASKSLETAKNNLDKLQTRSNVMARKLKFVELTSNTDNDTPTLDLNENDDED